MYRQEIRIKGGLVILEEVNERKRVSLDDYVKALVNEMGTDTGLIPAGVRLMRSKNNGYRYLLIEEPPTVRTVNYHGYMWDEQEHSEPPKLALPWIVYWARYNGSYVDTLYPALALASISSLDQPLYRPCLPNIHTSYGMSFNYACLGDTFRDRPSEPQAILDAWWSSRFNDDLGWIMPNIVVTNGQVAAESGRLNDSQRMQRARLRHWAALGPEDILRPELYARIGSVRELVGRV